MSYARIINGVIVSVADDLVGVSGRRVDNGDWIVDLATEDVEVRQAVGWFEVVETERPADTDIAVYRWRVVLDGGGVPVEAWIEYQRRLDDIIERRAGAHVKALRMIVGTTGSLTAGQLSAAVRAVAAAELDVIRFLHRTIVEEL